MPPLARHVHAHAGWVLRLDLTLHKLALMRDLPFNCFSARSSCCCWWLYTFTHLMASHTILSARFAFRDVPSSRLAASPPSRHASPSPLLLKASCPPACVFHSMFDVAHAVPCELGVSHNLQHASFITCEQLVGETAELHASNWLQSALSTPLSIIEGFTCTSYQKCCWDPNPSS